MWPWIKRWRDWTMAELWPLHRISPQPQALHYRYEKAGLTLHDSAIPWNAEAVVVEARLRLPEAARKKVDFSLRLPGLAPLHAENLRREEDGYRLWFRFATPLMSTTAELLWRDRVLGQLTLPILSQDDFLQQLRLLLPSLFVRLAEQTVACSTFVSTQCKGLTASAVLASPLSLAPLQELGLQVELRPERGGPGHRVPVQLSSSQLGARQALVSVSPKQFPRRMGTWMVSWMLGERVLSTQRLRAISQRTFLRSLRVSDTRFIVKSTKEGVCLRAQLPSLEGLDRVGPCFLVSSREAGMAGLCSLQVRALVTGAVQQPLLLDQEMLITDGPTMVAPGTLDSAELRQVNGFELRVKDEQLGVLSLSSAPSASFTGEGGFKPADDFIWSAAADDELHDRLNRLVDGTGGD